MRAPVIRDSHPVVLAAVGLLLLQLVLRGTTAASSWFFQDDFILMTQASRGLTADFLLQEYSGHVMPAGMLLVWLTTALAPLEWAPPLAVMLAVQLVAGLVLVRTVLLVVGRRAAALLPVALLALTPLTFNSVLWWGSGLQALPHQLALLVAVDGHVRWSRWGRTRHAVQSVLGVAVGLAFYEKALLVPVLLVLLSVLPLARERGLRRVSALWVGRRYWGAHVLLAASYAAFYLWRTGGVDGIASPPGDWSTVLREAGRTVAVALVGGPWRGAGDMPVAVHVAPPAAVLALVLALLVAVVAWTTARGGCPARDAWLVLGAYLLLDVGLLVTARGPLAPFLASDPRYYADAAPVAALALAFALRAALDGVRPVGARRALGRRSTVVVGLACAVLAAGSVHSTLVLGELADRNNARSYVEGLRAALQAEPEVVLADSPAPPQAIVRAFLGGQASVAQVIGPLPEADRLRSAGPQLRVFTADGRLVEGGLLDRVQAPPGPDGTCGYRVQGGGSRVVPLGGARGYAGHVKVSWVTGRARAGSIQVGGRRHEVVFARGLHQWWVPVDGVPDTVVVHAGEAPDDLCVIDVEAGRMWPPDG